MWVPQVSPLRPGRHSRQHKPRNRIWPQGIRVGVQLGVLVAPPSQEVETSAAERSHSGTSAVLRHADNSGRRASKTESFTRASSLKKTKPITTGEATSMSSVTGCCRLQLQDSIDTALKGNLRNGESWRTVQFNPSALRTKIATGKVMSELEAPAKITHVYRMNGLYRGASLIFLAVASFLMLAFWVGTATGQRNPKLLELILAPLFPIVGGIWVAFAFTSTRHPFP